MEILFIKPIYYVIYIIIFNSIVLVQLVKFVASSIAYPYSSSMFNKKMRANTNSRFGFEFRRCIERMTRMIKETTERQNHNMTASIIGGESYNEDLKSSFDSEASSSLSQKDIYMRLASNCELIDLYC